MKATRCPTLLLVFALPQLAFGWPAWANPAIPRSGDSEAGMIGQDASSWRVSLDISSSRGLSGGHLEMDGLTADGQLIETVPHAHRVEIDLTRYELGITRTFDANWDAFIRIPYFIKDQRADVIFPNGGTEEERAAAIRNGYAHHRTELYEGFADIELGVGWKTRGLLGEGSITRFSIGLTLPAGATATVRFSPAPFQNNALKAGKTAPKYQTRLPVPD